jgi:mannose-6-phosphate isomerase-like protein (cupin superfamily)
MEKVNLAQKFSLFTEYYSPKIAGELNDSHVKLCKLKGEFVWHHHDNEDELFLIVKGTLRIKYFDGDNEREVKLSEGEFVVVPRGVEHKPIADEEVHLILIEPKTTLNTGNVKNERTKEELQRI